MTTIVDELITFLKSVRLVDLFSNSYFDWPYQDHFKLDYLNHQVSLMCTFSNTNIQNKTIKFGQMIYSDNIYFIEKEFNISVELVVDVGHSYYILDITNQNNIANDDMIYTLTREEGITSLYDILLRVDNLIGLTTNLKNFRLEDYTDNIFMFNPDFFTDSHRMALIEAAFI